MIENISDMDLTIEQVGFLRSAYRRSPEASLLGPLIGANPVGWIATGVRQPGVAVHLAGATTRHRIVGDCWRRWLDASEQVRLPDIVGGCAMELRKFTLGDRVLVRLDRLATDSSARDIYKISRMLPAQANIWQYRVMRVGDSQERVVDETQLSKVPSATTARTVSESQQDLRRVRNASALARADRRAFRSDR